MPVYRKKGRGREKWRVVLYLNNDQREWTVTGSKADAEAFEARKRVELEAGRLQEHRVAPTFSDFCVRTYRPHAEAHLKTSTWKVRAYQLATLIEHFGDMKLTQLRPEHVELYKRKRLDAGVKPISINNELAVLQAVLSYARALAVPAPALAFKRLPVRGPGRVTCWTEAEVETLFRAVADIAPDLLPVVVFLANTGCRKGEALALRWENVDLEARMIKIWPSEAWQPKNDEPREIPIADALLPWLTAPRRSPEWVFPSRQGERYATWPTKTFDRARKLAGHGPSCDLFVALTAACTCAAKGTRGTKPRSKVDHDEGCGFRKAPEPKCTCGAKGLRGGPHTLRHTFASHFLKGVPDLFLLSKVLGHSETRTTKLYSHLLPDHLAKARNAVNLAPSIRPSALEARRRSGS